MDLYKFGMSDTELYYATEISLYLKQMDRTRAKRLIEKVVDAKIIDFKTMMPLQVSIHAPSLVRLVDETAAMREEEFFAIPDIKLRETLIKISGPMDGQELLNAMGLGFCEFLKELYRDLHARQRK